MNVSIGVASPSLLLSSITLAELKARINNKGEVTFLTGYLPALGVIKCFSVVVIEYIAQAIFSVI